MFHRASTWYAIVAIALLTPLALHLTGIWHRADLSAQEKEAKNAKGAAPAAGKVDVAPSRVVSVTVYPSSAMVTRQADVPAGKGIVELVISPLPAGVIVSSLNAEGSDGIRVLTTRFRSRQVVQDSRGDTRDLQNELAQLNLAREKIEADVKAVQENLKTLNKMEGFMGVTMIQATEKGALNADSAIALAKYIKDSRLETSRELVKLEQEAKANQAKASALQVRISAMSVVQTSTERDAVLVVERGNEGAAGKVRLHYLVEQASWRPQYKLRAGKAAKDPVQIEFLAAVNQNSGEDWANVNLVLSTAQPMLNASPPELQSLRVAAVHKASVSGVPTNVADLEAQIKNLRTKAQKDFNERKPNTGIGLFNTAAALDQSFELHNADTAIQRGCALAMREGPTVSYRVAAPLAVLSRAEEQVVEVARGQLAPDFYYKSVPLITTQVYRLADFVNKTDQVILPGEATMYIDSDFVGQMSLPLVAIGEAFSVGFGVDPQLQVTRQIVNRGQTTQGANQTLTFEYRTRINNYKNEAVKVQVWDRLPRPENNAIAVSLVEAKTKPEISKNPEYLRGPRTQNLLRWDMNVGPNTSGEKATSITYEFKMELANNMTISDLQSAGVFGQAARDLETALGPPSPEEQAAISAAIARLSPQDQALVQAQVFCAIDQDSRLGSMGPIQKIMLKNQPVFLCCKGCEAEARAHPDETLIKVQTLMNKLKKR